MLPLAALIFFSVSASAQLEPGASYAVNKDVKDPGPSVKHLDDYETSLTTDFQSFDPGDKSGEPMMSSHTEQVLKARKLPKPEAKGGKTDSTERTELQFQRLVTTSRVKVMSLARPIEMRADMGSALAGLGLVVATDGKGGTKYENLDQVRRDALARASDSSSRTALNTMFSQSVMGKVGMPGQDTGCLASLPGKKAGDRWKARGGTAETHLDIDCVFEGWADAAGKKVVVLTFRIPKQKTVVRQPNGVPGVTETESDGTLYLDPGTGETAVKVVSRITAVPTDEELARMKAKGQEPPANRSVSTSLAHTRGE